MTNRNRIVATTLALLMLVPAVALLSPAATAQDPVPTKPAVMFEPLPNLRQFLYPRFESTPTGQPDCAQGARELALNPAPRLAGSITGRAQCPFTITVAPDPVVFATPTDLDPSRRIAFTGNTSLAYHHEGNVPDGVTLTITVASDAQTIATGTLVGEDNRPAFDVPLTLAGPTATTGRVFMDANKTVRLSLVAAGQTAGDTLPVPATWRIDDTASFLELRSDDAVRAAIWVTDEKDALRDVFAPITNESLRVEDQDRRIVGHFALESAFGIDDARAGQPPQFSILYEGRPREIGAGGRTVLAGVYNTSAAVSDQGVAIWSFPAGTVDYRGFQSGAYILRAEKNHHQGAPISRATEKPFSITSQTVELKPFTDPRNPAIAETQSHLVAPGQTTTYILAVNNTGAVNDNFTINVSAPNAPPGWGVNVGGPDVLQRRLAVPAKETRVFTVTVNAPFGATGQVIHLVNVTSSIDPAARSRDLTLVTSTSTQIEREVGVFLLARDLALEPGVETHYPVYVWNRGTRVANVSLEIIENQIAGWSADLAFGNNNVDRIVVSGIPAGDIAVATLKMKGPVSQAVPTHPITLNVTSQDVQGVSAERTLTFALRAVSGVRVTVLDKVGAAGHLAELTADDTAVQFTEGGPEQTRPNCVGDCQQDGVNGLWFRTWISNTGRLTDSFDLTLDSLDNNCVAPGPGRPTSPPVFPTATTTTDFGFYTRSAGGIPSRTSAIGDLPPGKTAEVYVYVPVRTDISPCTTEDNAETETFSFVVQARGRGTGAIGRSGAFAEARNVVADNRPGTNGVHLEGVVRESGYSASTPYVDITNASKTSITGAIEPGKNLTYYVRMTNLATWSEYTDNNGRRLAPDMKISLSGVHREAGWNVSIRPVLEPGQNDILRNPYAAEYNLSNVNSFVNPTRREAWFDRELEVVVQAPSIENATALAGLSDEFQIIAVTNDTNHRATLEIVTVVADLANITLRADSNTVLAHPGKPGALLLYVTNNGSSPAMVTLRSSMTSDTPNAGSWQFSQTEQVFPLAAYKNRTVALLITPPVGSTQGAGGTVNVSVEYARDPKDLNRTTNVTLRPTIEVVAPGTLSLTAGTTDATIGQSGTANYTMTLRNAGSLSVPFKLTATPIPNWSVTVSPAEGTLNPGESRTVVLVLQAPADVISQSRFASVVKVEEVNAANNFDTVAFNVNILGGTALPRLSAPNLVKRVDRDGIQSFEVSVQNVGSAAGRISLETRSQDPNWITNVVDSRGNPITGVQLGPNELVNVNVTVRAPFNVLERAVTPVELTAYSPDQTQSAKVVLSAEIHDYGVQLSLSPANKDLLPGLTSEFTLKVRNTGNDNDTLNVSVNLIDLPEWSVSFSSEEVRLEPNQETEIRATIRSPTGPLPTPRAYTFPFWVGTRGGQEVNLSKNMTVSAVVTVPNYRAYDVDRDSQLEIAVDLDKRSANGFEEFREIFTEGLTTQVVAKGLFEGRTTFFLDVPADGRPYDGVADVWFNPETVFGFEIAHAPDVNGDGTPDYFVDADRDGKLDKVFDSATERFWDALEVKVYNDDRIQYLVDMSGDGKPDRFYDPETQTVTRTQKADEVGTDYVGIDVNDDDRVDYYYNTRTKETSQAEVANVGSFARDYWYFFVGFALLVLISVVLLVRRRRAP